MAYRETITRPICSDCDRTAIRDRPGSAFYCPSCPTGTPLVAQHDHGYRFDIGDWWCKTCDVNSDYCDADR